MARRTGDGRVDRTVRAGLDVHKKTVVACVRTPGDGKCRRSRVRTFGTTMTGLEALGEWLGAHGVTHAAMESTGVYWCPVYAVLEERFALLLVNARHVKNVPGRKTDVKDSEWLARLLECGLLKGSFVPPREIRNLRDLTRLRKALVRDRSRQVARVGKILELANVKLGSGVADIMGRDGPGHPGGDGPGRGGSACAGPGSARGSLVRKARGTGRSGARADPGPPQVPASEPSRHHRPPVGAHRGARRADRGGHAPLSRPRWSSLRACRA